MATTMITATASQYASAALHLERRSEWRVVRISNVRYVALPSGTSGKTYLARADAAGCECRWYSSTGRQCSHMLALELAAMESELAAEQSPRTAPVLDPKADALLLAKLQADQHERARYLRLIGYAYGEEIEDARYAQLSAQIGRLQARVAGKSAAFVLNELVA